MGRYTDASSVGVPFRPSPRTLATAIWEFDPRASVVDAAPDFPESDQLALVNWAVAADSCARLDFADAFASDFQRAWGYVATIDESDGADNTDTGYRFEIVCKFPYRISGFGDSVAEASWFYGRLRAYSSNALLTDASPVRLGSIVSGFATACYTGNGRANLDSWSVVTDVLLPHHSTFSDFRPCLFLGVVTCGFAEWGESPPATLPRRPDFCFDEWLIDWLPAIGGLPHAAQEHVENRITGVRITPPMEDPNLFLRNRRVTMNADPNHVGAKRTVSFKKDTSYVRPRGRSASRNP